MRTTKSHHARSDSQAIDQSTSPARHAGLPIEIQTQIAELCEWYTSRDIRKEQWKLLQIATSGASDEDGLVSARLISDWMFTQLQVTELLSALLDHFGDPVTIRQDG